jgi:hypothetical protein
VLEKKRSKRIDIPDVVPGLEEAISSMHQHQDERNISEILLGAYTNLNPGNQSKFIDNIGDVLERYTINFEKYIGAVSIGRLFDDSPEQRLEEGRSKLLDFLRDGLYFASRLYTIFQNEGDLGKSKLQTYSKARNLLKSFDELFLIISDIDSGFFYPDNNNYEDFDLKKEILDGHFKNVRKITSKGIKLKNKDSNEYIMGYHTQVLINKHGVEVGVRYLQELDINPLEEENEKKVYEIVNWISDKFMFYAPMLTIPGDKFGIEEQIGFLDDETFKYLENLKERQDIGNLYVEKFKAAIRTYRLQKEFVDVKPFSP